MKTVAKSKLKFEKGNFMKRYTKKQIRDYVQTGAATDITANGADLNLNLSCIGLSFGQYGMNAGLFRENETGKLYAVTARNGTLFYYA